MTATTQSLQHQSVNCLQFLRVVYRAVRHAWTYWKTIFGEASFLKWIFRISDVAPWNQWQFSKEAAPMVPCRHINRHNDISQTLLWAVLRQIFPPCWNMFFLLFTSISSSCDILHSSKCIPMYMFMWICFRSSCPVNIYTCIHTSWLLIYSCIISVTGSLVFQWSVINKSWFSMWYKKCLCSKHWFTSSASSFVHSQTLRHWSQPSEVELDTKFISAPGNKQTLFPSWLEMVCLWHTGSLYWSGGSDNRCVPKHVSSSSPTCFPLQHLLISTNETNQHASMKLYSWVMHSCLWLTLVKHVYKPIRMTRVE